MVTGALRRLAGVSTVLAFGLAIAGCGSSGKRGTGGNGGNDTGGVGTIGGGGGNGGGGGHGGGGSGGNPGGTGNISGTDASNDLPVGTGGSPAGDASTDGQTLDGLPCGREGDPCCAGDTCDPGTICNHLYSGSSSLGRCIKCGTAGIDIPCCPGNSCADNGCCVDACVGTLGCAGVPAYCVAAGTACPNTFPAGTCSAAPAGSCGTCGGVGQACCTPGSGPPFCTSTNTYCSPQNSVDGGSVGGCLPCGAAGQACCPVFSRVSSARPDVFCKTGLTCRPGATMSTCEP